MEIINMQSSHTDQSAIEKITGLQHGNSICYSGYREGQDPRLGIFPSYEEVKEDLLLLADNWSFLRLYDCSKHAETVLEVIETEKLDFHIMLGVDMAAEVSNPNCPWGAYFDDEKLVENKRHNSDEIDQLITLAARYPKSVFSVSVGNEASVEWTDHMVPVDSHPDKPIVITEAGWTTQSNGQGIESWNASEVLQTAYYAQLLQWTTKERILTFVFEAFDEPWKGSDHPQEPEKHWGLFKVDRKPKQVMQGAYS
jgi:exo-beta-1,3-glucanase (GH17 family)